MYVTDELQEKIIATLKRDCDVVICSEEFKYVTYPEVREGRYAIGSWGTVYNIDRGIIMAQSTTPQGYRTVGLALTDSGKFKQFKVHRLLAWEFIDGYDESTGRTIVNHKNSNRSANYVDNLEWCTSQENSIHGFNNDITYSAKRSLTEKEVKKICELFQDGYKVIEVFRIITGLQHKLDDEQTYKKIVRIHTRTYYNNISKYYKW